jgi:cytochrome c-type biogenesis protein
MVATVNPCGFPMLPAYLSYFIGVDGDGDTPGTARVPRALLAGAAVSLGFLAVFVTLGIPINAGRTWIYDVMPWLTIVVGVVLVAFGSAMLLGYRLYAAFPRLNMGGRTRGFWSMVAFGVSYAVASISCTLPLILPVVVAQSNVAAGFLTFGAYALGMGVVLMGLSVALALARGGLVRRLRSLVAHVDRIAGVLLVAVGAYLVYYWVVNLSSDPSDPVGSSPVAAIDGLSADLSTWLADGGVQLGLVLVALLVAALALSLFLRRRVRRPADPRPPSLAARARGRGPEAL